MSRAEDLVAAVERTFASAHPGDAFLQGTFEGCEPYDEVGAFCDWLVPTFVIVTVAPGMTAPVLSKTVPLMPPIPSRRIQKPLLAATLSESTGSLKVTFTVAFTDTAVLLSTGTTASTRGPSGCGRVVNEAA